MKSFQDTIGKDLVLIKKKLLHMKKQFGRKGGLLKLKESGGAQTEDLFSRPVWARKIIDFTDMIGRVNGFRYLLVAVDAYTGWPEAVPVEAEDAKMSQLRANMPVSRFALHTCCTSGL
ncbi:hypothetical protein D4764_15G0008730 [Takifugu flavidus]|uniref:Integrase catalytic domain-containing protein n=1 Tax=Takifugu flavidus TaxID=433684 RepID=A0A5C6P3I7_9TELE|nr:hypothetical protein D4764_15G0008730 [Takifugu flavidus]